MRPEILDHPRPEADEPHDLIVKVGSNQVEVDAVLGLLALRNELEEQARARADQQNCRVVLEVDDAQRAQPLDLGFVIRRYRVSVERRGPEPGERTRMGTVDNDVTESGHLPSVSCRTRHPQAGRVVGGQLARILPSGSAEDRLSGWLRTLTGMACRISELVIDAADPDRLAAFWSQVLGYVELGREDDGSIEIGPPDAGFGGPQPTLVLSPGGDPRTGKLRLHIDVNATDRDQDAELERLLALGATPADVGQTGTESWHVLADPEGNEFCLLHTRLQPL